jgi:hypothetical protein
LSPATARAWSIAASMPPSVTNVKGASARGHPSGTVWVTTTTGAMVASPRAGEVEELAPHQHGTDRVEDLAEVGGAGGGHLTRHVRVGGGNHDVAVAYHLKRWSKPVSPGPLAPWPPGPLAAGGWRLAAGGWRLAAGGWRLAAGGWRLAAGEQRFDAPIPRMRDGNKSFRIS